MSRGAADAPSVARRAVLGAIPPAVLPLVRRVISAADERDLPVYLVGGPVRDHLLGRPLRDVDLMVERRTGRGAPQLARAARGPGLRAVAHERFGTARLEGGGGAVDLATARSESYAHPGALPRVAPGTLEQDLHRRDFAVNALAVPLSRAARRLRPALIDPEGGLADLRTRRLRILHPRSFHDDPTRALRAARLAPRLGFRLSHGSVAALGEALRAGVFAEVSGERLRREIEKLFEDAVLGLEPERALALLEAWGVLPALHAGLGPRASRAPLRRLARALRDPPWHWTGLRPLGPGLALWLAPLPPARRRASLERLAVRGALRAEVLGFPALRSGLLRALERAPGRGEVDARLAGCSDERLLALHASGSARARRRIERFVREDRARPTPIDGAELVRLGLAGPAVGRALARLRRDYLNGVLRSSEQVLERAERLAKRARA